MPNQRESYDELLIQVNEFIRERSGESWEETCRAARKKFDLSRVELRELLGVTDFLDFSAEESTPK